MAWVDWEARFRASAEMPPLTVGVVDVARLPDDLGRTRSGHVELNAALPADAADTTLLHEIAHVFVETRCPVLTGAAPLLPEAFALYASGDAARRLAEGGAPPTLSSARDWLVAHASDTRPEPRAAARALVRVLARGDTQEAWDAFFARLLGTCGDESFSSGRALSEFLDVARGASAPPVASSLDFVLVDGHSGEILAEEGAPRRRAPAGSILKPSLVAAVPDLMEPRPARDDPSWHCPGPPRAGEPMRWEAALARSCNGYFLDFVPRGPDPFALWEEWLARLGLPQPPRTMEGRIGLLGDYALSPLEAVRLFAWLDRSAPFVLDALRRTASDGTLAAASDAGWFAARGIALKTGTLRDAASRPLHAWIVASGARSAAGAPSFLAALHATGRAPAMLLPDLRRRLDEAPTGLDGPAEVQILGLVPPGTVGLACEAGVPLASRSPGGTWRLEPPGSARASGTLASGAWYVCPASGLVLSFPGADGAPLTRRYHGALRVEEPSASPPSGVPLRATSARARAGSRYVLVTSERSYVTSSILSESPTVHEELLKALSLVVRNNRLSRRHGDRPPCDTTHCNLFAHDVSVPPRARARARAAVSAVASFEIAPPPGGRIWLPFFLGGRHPWTEIRSAATVREELGLDGDPVRIARRADGGIDLEARGAAARKIPCEILRNQLRLLSCPSAVERSGDGFIFRGQGEGHGEGLDLTAASAAAAEGADFRALLHRYFPGIRIEPCPPEATRPAATSSAPGSSGPSASAPAARPADAP